MVRRISTLSIKNYVLFIDFMKVHGRELKDIGGAQKILLLPSLDKQEMEIITFFKSKDDYNNFVEYHVEKFDDDFTKNVLGSGIGKLLRKNYVCDEVIEI